jgi:hypothetical protein
LIFFPYEKKNIKIILCSIFITMYIMFFLDEICFFQHGRPSDRYF